MKNKILVVGVITIVLLIGFIFIKNMEEIFSKSNPNEKLFFNEITKVSELSITNIEQLPENYSLEKAVEDGAYAKTLSKIYNQEKLNKFLDDISDKKESFIRIIRFTDEGDLMIADITYEDSIYKICIDMTRDKFSNDSDRKYHYYAYKDLTINDNKLTFSNPVNITLNNADNDIYHSEESLLINL